MPSIVAIIPARSGSKSLANKNILSFLGEPLIAHSIKFAKSSSMISRVIFDSDNVEYNKIAVEYGAEVLYQRPSNLAGHLTKDIKVFDHALNWLKKNENYTPDICVHLRPTYPIRRLDDLHNMIKILLEDNTLDSVRSITKAAQTPYKMWLSDENNILSPVTNSEFVEPYNSPRQILPVVYTQNASIDIIWTKTILEKNSMTGDKIYGYKMNDMLDIDTLAEFTDFQIKLLTNKNNLKNKTFCFDIDGVIASLTPDNNYSNAKPLKKNIKTINKLYNMGGKILLFTARGTITGIDWRQTTERQMKEWGVKYHELRLGKPAADFYIDDKLIRIEQLNSILR